MPKGSAFPCSKAITPSSSHWVLYLTVYRKWRELYSVNAPWLLPNFLCPPAWLAAVYHSSSTDSRPGAPFPSCSVAHPWPQTARGSRSTQTAQITLGEAALPDHRAQTAAHSTLGYSKHQERDGTDWWWHHSDQGMAYCSCPKFPYTAILWAMVLQPCPCSWTDFRKPLQWEKLNCKFLEFFCSIFVTLFKY